MPHQFFTLSHFQRISTEHKQSTLENGHLSSSMSENPQSPTPRLPAAPQAGLSRAARRCAAGVLRTLRGGPTGWDGGPRGSVRRSAGGGSVPARWSASGAQTQSPVEAARVGWTSWKKT